MHSISYNVITPTCTVLASAAQANTTPMQRPNSATGQACLSSTVITAHNILLPAGVNSRIALQSLCLWYSDRNASLSTLKSPSFRALVLLYWYKVYIRKVIRSEFTISSHFLSLCLGLRVLGRIPTRALDQATATQSPRCSTSVCLQDSKNRENLQINRTATVQQYRYSSIEQFSKYQKPREPTNQQDSNSTAVQV